MRLWHYQLLPYLPELQFKGQLRELVMIMRDWRDKGTTNHLLINYVMNYPRAELVQYFQMYNQEYFRRYGRPLEKYIEEFMDFAEGSESLQQGKIFHGAHDYIYLKICMANLYEKHLGIGASRVSADEWGKLLAGFKKITGEDYAI